MMSPDGFSQAPAEEYKWEFRGGAGLAAHWDCLKEKKKIRFVCHC